MLVDDRKHLAGLEVLEPRPAQILVRPAARRRAFGENPALHRLTEQVGLALFERLQSRRGA